jgi:cytosine/uracil/thiamine/allantoin permease
MNMKRAFPLVLIAFLCTTLSSCELVEGIFKAGVWSGIIIVVVVLALLIWILAKIFGGGKG